MLIANPIYDAVFKYLLEDTDIAKKLLAAIIGEEIVDIEVQPQEQTTLSEVYLVKIFRLDFKATIKTKDGQLKKILIELQKGKQLVDIMRFRKYLAENYQKEDEIRNENGTVEKYVLPIITIYFLGFKLQNVTSALLKVNRIYKDMVTNQELHIKEDFIEQLTHDSFIIQIPQLTIKQQTRLEKILSVFNQTFVLEDNHRILNFPSEMEDELVEQMVKRLSKATENEHVRKQIEAEEIFDSALEKVLRKKDAENEQKLLEFKKVMEAQIAAQAKEIEDLKKRLGEL